MGRPVVLVIRKDDGFSARLRDAGCEVSNLELIKTETADDLSELDSTLAQLDDYDGLFFTSPAAAEVFVQRLNASGRRSCPKAYVLGDRAKAVLENAGLDVVHDGAANTVEELLASFDEAEFTGKRFLFVRGNRSLRTISRLLNSKARIDEVVVYRTVENTPYKTSLESLSEQLKKGEIDWLCFFSPSGVERFRQLFGAGLPPNTKVAVIGETTAREAGKSLNVHFVSGRANGEDFATELIEKIKRSE